MTSSARTKAIFLGTGPSMGVPVLGCGCAVCCSPDPRDKRMRASLRVDAPGGTIVIDSGPDFRHQALKTNLSQLDAVIFTHAHADHILGLDEMRIFNFRTKRAMPLYGSEETFEQIKKVFFYAFDRYSTYEWKPQYELHPVRPSEPFEVVGISLLPIPVEHGGVPVLGFRIGNFAYITDALSIPEASFPLLAGVEIFVVNALRREKHSSHMCLDEALAAIARVGAKRAFLTHMTHEFGYEALSRTLPPAVAPAHDGLELEIQP